MRSPRRGHFHLPPTVNCRSVPTQKQTNKILLCRPYSRFTGNQRMGQEWRHASTQLFPISGLTVKSQKRTKKISTVRDKKNWKSYYKITKEMGGNGTQLLVVFPSSSLRRCMAPSCLALHETLRGHNRRTIQKEANLNGKNHRAPPSYCKVDPIGTKC
jgi:hypothetical protein